jgi:hypothetical protein
MKFILIPVFLHTPHFNLRRACVLFENHIPEVTHFPNPAQRSFLLKHPYCGLEGKNKKKSKDFSFDITMLPKSTLRPTKKNTLFEI